MKAYGVIMAGGGGTRLWPFSRQQLPKQLLNLTGKDVLISETVDRLRGLISLADIYIVTNANQADVIEKVVGDRIPKENILKEPAARNTAPCIGYAAVEIKRRHKDGIMVVLPADHYIDPPERFRENCKQAIHEAEASDKLLTIGIKATYPSTSYGYIYSEEKMNSAIRSVVAFKEKPEKKLAEEYLSSGKYEWNSGIFIWRVSTILSLYERFVPDIYEKLIKLNQENIQIIYPQIRKISVDYAILEPCAELGLVEMVRSDFTWSDLGGWEALAALHQKDKNGNILVGDVILEDCYNCFAFVTQGTVTIQGLTDMLIVRTKDISYITHRGDESSVQKMLKLLIEAGREELT